MQYNDSFKGNIKTSLLVKFEMIDSTTINQTLSLWATPHLIDSIGLSWTLKISLHLSLIYLFIGISLA